MLTREQARTTKRAVPVVSLKVPAPGLFVAQVIDESTNRRSPCGAWCLGRAAPAGSRQGKIVLVQHRDVIDPETDGGYAIKRYQSEKQGDGGRLAA